jgi:uncharacterized protein (DUF1810 family)
LRVLSGTHDNCSDFTTQRQQQRPLCSLSTTTRLYSIKGLEEARQYLAHPVLGRRLRESAEAVLSVQGRLASDIFGHPDDWKLQSSMTLFELVSSPDSVFGRVLDKYYQGKRDSRTLRIVGKA